MTDLADGGRPATTFLMPGGRAEWRRFGLFLGVGLVGLALDTALFAALHGAGLSRAGGRAASLSAATLATFGLNRRFTFAAHGPRQPRRLARYALVTLVAQGFSYGLFLAVSAAAPALPAASALVAGAAAATLLSFAGQRLFTFRGA